MPSSRACFAPVLFLPLILVASGCGGASDGIPREPLSGKVTIDGQPMSTGTISFMPVDTSGPATAVGAVIKDGDFSVPVSEGLAPGAYKVAISAPVPDTKAIAKLAKGRGAEATGGTGVPGAEDDVPMRESIPSRYNSQTELKADVTKGGPNTFDYTLKAK